VDECKPLPSNISSMGPSAGSSAEVMVVRSAPKKLNVIAARLSLMQRRKWRLKAVFESSPTHFSFKS